MHEAQCIRTGCVLAALIVTATAALAEPGAPRLRFPSDTWCGINEVVHGEPRGVAASLDTVYLLGGPGRLDGTFQNAAGHPDWHGWTSEDRTAPDLTQPRWTVTEEPALVIAGSRSLWCGVQYPEPGPVPVPGFGYGNNWAEVLLFRHQVADPGVASPVTWTLKLRHDTEPQYDTVVLEWSRAGQWQELQRFDGASVGVLDLVYQFDVQPGDHAGPDADEIQLRVRFDSDGAWSDEDGLFATALGACQLDDIVVAVGGVVIDEADLEDGTMGAWQWDPLPGVGDFAWLWSNLADLDPCISNHTPQVAFIDDGLVVPGTGGTTCISWCYGPGGYIVNNTGGLAGPGHYLDNIIKSPVLEWPVLTDAASLAYEVYLHDSFGPGWPGMIHRWAVRSVDTGDPADLESAPWRTGNVIYLGGPAYWRLHQALAPLLEPGRTHIQVGLGVVQVGWTWGWDGVDGTPAPYFDNVAVLAHQFGGPSITAREIDLAQDSFPANPTLDFDNLANNAVRFDMARSVAPAAHLINQPGDSIVVDVKAARAGTELVLPPTMHVRMRANPLYDSVRVLPPAFTRDGNLIEGVVDGLVTYTAGGQPVADRFNFDLPDGDFFFPGDVIHYYIRAEDTGGGVTTLPGDLDTFGDFGDEFAHDRRFIVRALPTMFSDVPCDQPRMLFWDDSGGQEVHAWLDALRDIGLREGLQFDHFYTNGPTSGVGNGLGGRATVDHLMGYDALLYTSGQLSFRTLSNGDFSWDPSNDIAVVGNWLDEGKTAFMTGDDLVFSLDIQGAAGQAFIQDHVGVTLIQQSIRSLINGQTAPLIRAVPGNGVFELVPEWIADGGCPSLNSFDAYTVIDAQLLAEFTNPAGQPGAYPYAAGSRHVDAQSGAQVIVLPYAFHEINDAPGFEPPPGYAGIPARAILLKDVLGSFGVLPPPPPIASPPPAAVLSVASHPNPFNPATTIKLTVPTTGEVSLKVFNVRGELVRVLIDGRLEVGPHDVTWDGRNQAGAPVASGVYFHEVRAGGDVRVGKMVLAK